MQRGAQQRQPQVEELEKELARLKQDGQAYREDLTQQLEAAKQAAAQARHDAAQASSQAAHEAKQVQLLQSDRAHMADIADSWRKQAHENQVYFIPINFYRCSSRWLGVYKACSNLVLNANLPQHPRHSVAP